MHAARQQEPLASEASCSGGATRLFWRSAAQRLVVQERLLAIATLDVCIDCDEALIAVEREKGSNVRVNEEMPRLNVFLQGRNNGGTTCTAILGLKYEIDALGGRELVYEPRVTLQVSLRVAEWCAQRNSGI